MLTCRDCIKAVSTDKADAGLVRLFALFAAALVLVCALPLISCSRVEQSSELGNGWEPLKQMELKFAREFSVKYYEGGYKLITVRDGGRFLTVPEQAEVPKGIAGDIAVLQMPLKNIYLASSAIMCLFDGLERLDAVRFCALREDGWYIENARRAMQRGEMLFAGKYSEPDYELLLSENCPLAVENTMIGHASGVRDQLERLGIPVMIEHSSFETHPLGRTEWIKLYGALLDEEERAERLFEEQKNYLDRIGDSPDTGKSVVFFHVSSSGYAVCRKSGDYVSKMIALAGGKYVFDDIGDPDSASATVNVEMETFFKQARDADVIIYNSTIAGQVASLSEFIALNPMLEELKAVKNGSVWCTNRNMYQQMLEFGQLINEFNLIFTGEGELTQLEYVYRLD